MYTFLFNSHPGCVCDSGFEGIFCEYKTGEAPYYKKPSGIPLGLGITIPLVLVGTAFGFLWKKRNEKKKQDATDVPTAAGDLAMGDLKADHADII